MEKLLAKIRNKKLKGNISLLVILILLASSVISLLSINQIQRLITYGNMTFNYFRAFYIAKAGTELWLTEVYNRWDGFNQTINTGDSIVQDNLVWIYTGFEPSFRMDIVWSFNLLTNDITKTDDCNENEIELAPNAWIMLSLFSDPVEWIPNILSDNDSFTSLPQNTIRQLEFENSESISNNLTFAFFNYKRDDELKDYYMDNIVVKKDQSSLKAFLIDPEVLSLINNSDSETKKYLTIKNGWNNAVKFCISMGNNEIPYSNSLITVFWHYGDMEVWIQSIVKKGVPDWTLNVLGEPSGSI